MHMPQTELNEPSPMRKKAQAHAQEIIDACWAISEDDRASGNTPRMRYGALDSALCMENLILKLVSKYLHKNNPEILKDFQDNLQKLRMGYGRIIWDLYNDHDGCDFSCGTMYHVFHNGYYAHLMEEILKTTVNQIIEYGLEDELIGAGILINIPPKTIEKDIVKNITIENLSFCYLKVSKNENKCADLSIRNIHNVYVIQGLNHEPYSELENKNFLHFIAIKGFINSADSNKFTFNGSVETNNPKLESESCTQNGEFIFKRENNEVWKLDTENIPCLSEHQTVIIKTNP